MNPVKIFCTSGSEEITKNIAQQLDKRLPDSMQSHGVGKVLFKTFSNDNIQAEVENVRGSFAVVVHTQVPPVAAHMIELFSLLDAIVNSHPADVLLVFPYLPYSRSDRKNKPRISTLGQLFPKIFSNVLNVQRVLLFEPHATHLKHYFDPTADELSAVYLFMNFLERNVFNRFDKKQCTIVFADEGAARRYKKLAQLLTLPRAYIDKDRTDDNENIALDSIAGNTENRICILIDDEILTGKTAVEDACLLKEKGKADRIIMCAAHPVLADKLKSIEEVIRYIEDSPIDELAVTNSIPVSYKASLSLSKKIKVLDVAPLLAEGVSRILLDKSLSDLHSYENVGLYYKDAL